MSGKTVEQARAEFVDALARWYSFNGLRFTTEARALLAALEAKPEEAGPPKPAERTPETAEYYLERIIEPHPEYVSHLDVQRAKAAHTAVRELRAERDELKRRIEKARDVMHSTFPSDCQCPQCRARRILEGTDA